jgi:26S proteasome regulatory subunit N9
MKLDIYKKIDANLKDLFLKVKNGDYGYINNKKAITKSLQSFIAKDKLEDVYAFLKEKTYLIALVNICFYNNERLITIESICNILEIDKITCYNLIIKANAKKLIKSEIDGESETVQTSYIVPRILSDEDLVEIENKYAAWKCKIDEVIKMM